MAIINQQLDDLPSHIAIIMDGNGRWAHANGYPRHTGHRNGVIATRNIVEAAADIGVKALTLFAFSSENWKRPAEEVNSLMRLFLEVLQREVDTLDKNGIKIRFIGAREQLSKGLQEKLDSAEKQTASNYRMNLVLAVAYGGRWDIVQAVRKLANEIEASSLRAEEITEKLINERLSLADIPPPDLLIRTGGEHRISNFLLWELAYTELYFSDAFWPDFTPENLNEAIKFYLSRQRRFGKTSEQAIGG
ncbi:MAG: polyprenyl diphosphate synthase [Pseudomonadota bacterium]|nr:polyprenyl diphosphate synthase [Pseudomonadota bacterium]